MTLPNFLGIGASRSGSSWLFRQLKGHPEVYVPSRRKEVNFFNVYYHRGLDWYEEFFRDASDCESYKAIGEFSPGYLSDPAVPGRIREQVRNCKFLLILRDPVERAYSQWRSRLQKRAESRSFEQYIVEDEEPILLSLYARHLNKYFALFPRERFLVLIFERVMADPTVHLKEISEFLNIDAGKFVLNKTSDRVNPSYMPRFPRAYYFAFQIKQFFRRNDLDSIANMGKKLGVERLFGRKSSPPPLKESTRAQLLKRFWTDIRRLEEVIGNDLPEWKKL